MNRSFSILLIALQLCALGFIRSGQAQEPRVWRGKSGNSNIEAILVTANKTHVRIRKTNGLLIDVPIAALHVTDIEYLQKEGYLKGGAVNPDKPAMNRAQNDNAAVNGKAATSGPFIHVLTEDGRSVLAGIPFGTSRSASMVVVPTSERNFYKLGALALKTSAGEELIDSFFRLDGDLRFLIRRNLKDIKPVVIADAKEMKRVRKGTDVTVWLTNPAAGANPTLRAYRETHAIKAVVTEGDQVVGFKLELTPKSEDSAGLVFYRNKVVGVVSPVSRSKLLAISKRSGQPNDRLVDVVPINKYCLPKNPQVVLTRGFWWASDLQQIELRKKTVTVLFGTDRELPKNAMVQLYKVEGRRYQQNLDLKPTGIRELKEDEIQQWSVEMQSKLPGTKLPNRVYVAAFPCDFELAAANLKLSVRLIGEDRKRKKIELADFTAAVRHRNSYQSVAMADTNLWKNVEEHFLESHPITNSQTIYQAIGEKEAPELKGLEVIPQIFGQKQYDGTVIFECPEKSRADISHPQFVLPSDPRERIDAVFTLSKGRIIHRLDLAGRVITHRVEIPGSRNRQKNGNIIVRNQSGLVVAVSGGLLVLNPDNLEQEHWIPGVEVSELATLPNQRGVIGINSSSIWIVDTENGHPVHRIKNEIGMIGEEVPKLVRRTGNRLERILFQPLTNSLIGLVGRTIFRFEFDGKDLHFKERSKAGLNMADLSISNFWMSEDGNFVSGFPFGVPYREFKPQPLQNPVFDLYVTSDLKEPVASFIPSRLEKGRYSIVAKNGEMRILQEPLMPGFRGRMATIPGRSQFLAFKEGDNETKPTLGLFNSKQEDYTTTFKRSVAGRMVAANVNDNSGPPNANSDGPSRSDSAVLKPVKVDAPAALNIWNEGEFRIAKIRMGDSKSNVVSNHRATDPIADGTLNAIDLMKMDGEERQKALGVRQPKSRNPLNAFPKMAQAVFSSDGESLLLGRSEGLIQRIDSKTMRIVAQLDLGEAIENSAARGKLLSPGYRARPQTMTKTSLGLAVAIAPQQTVYIIDETTLEVKDKISVPFVTEILGSSKHPYLLCSLESKKGILFDVAAKKEVQQFKALTYSGSGAKKHSLENLFGFATPFLADGKTILARQSIWQLEGNQLVEKQKLGRQSGGKESWYFNDAGYVYRSVPNQPTLFFETGNLKRPVFQIERGKRFFGIEPGSGLAMTQSPPGQLFLETERGDAIYQLGFWPEVGEIYVDPDSRNGFLLFGKDRVLPTSQNNRPALYWITYTPRN